MTFIETLAKLDIFWIKQSSGFAKNFNGIKPGINISWGNLHSNIFTNETPDEFVAIIGCPIIGEAINLRSSLDIVSMRESANFEKLKSINGQFIFIVINKRYDCIEIINDRFASFPVYYINTPKYFILSHSYLALARQMKRLGILELVPSYLYEYVRMQRLFGDKTLDTSSKYLRPASSLLVKREECKLKQYWTPNYTKIETNKDLAGARLAELIKASMKRLTSDKKTFGIMLSAGHDSRTIAMAAPESMTCFTVAYSENLEVTLARRIAQSTGHKHKFIRLEKNHLSKIAGDAGRLCGGMYTIDNALFLNIKTSISDSVDVLLHGHAIDYLFQGMYIPNKAIKIFGRQTFIKRAKSLPKDLASYFLQNISYRLKYVEHSDYVKDPYVDSTEAELQESIQQELNYAPSSCQTQQDKWEHLTVSCLSRHYSWPNIGSTMSATTQRSPCFDNDIFDFYLSLPVELRVTAAALRSAQLTLNKPAALIETANFGLPAAESPLFKTLRLIIKKLQRDITGKKQYYAPSPKDRTWPDRDKHLSEAKGYQSLVRQAVKSDRLKKCLPQLDWNKIQQLSEKSIDKPNGGAGFLISLVTLDLFLEELAK